MIVPARIFLRLNVNGSNLSAVLARSEIRARAIVGVVKTQTCWARRERDDALAVRGNKGRTFLGGPIHSGRNFLPVPVKLFRRIGVVEDRDGDRLPFLETQQRTGELAIVGNGGDKVLPSNLYDLIADMDFVCGGGSFRLRD